MSETKNDLNRPRILNQMVYLSTAGDGPIMAVIAHSKVLGAEPLYIRHLQNGSDTRSYHPSQIFRNNPPTTQVHNYSTNTSTAVAALTQWSKYSMSNRKRQSISVDPEIWERFRIECIRRRIKPADALGQALDAWVGWRAMDVSRSGHFDMGPEIYRGEVVNKSAERHYHFDVSGQFLPDGPPESYDATQSHTFHIPVQVDYPDDEGDLGPPADLEPEEPFVPPDPDKLLAKLREAHPGAVPQPVVKRKPKPLPESLVKLGVKKGMK